MLIYLPPPLSSLPPSPPLPLILTVLQVVVFFVQTAKKFEYPELTVVQRYIPHLRTFIDQISATQEIILY